MAVQYSYEIILASVENVKENIGRRKNSRLLNSKRELRSYRSIVIIRIVGCPIRHNIRLASAACIVDCLMTLVVRVRLIGVIIEICSIGSIVWIVLIGPVVELRFCMRFPRCFSHIFLLSEPKKTTHFELCVATIT